MKFKKYMKKKYPDLLHIPTGFKRLGNYMILRSTYNLENQLGNAILNEFPWCKGVYQYNTTTGESRIPQIRYLAGNKETKIIHKENKVLYHLDIARIMFSGGNTNLRKRLVNELREGEFLVDMFAAVGNLSLQPLFYKRNNAILIEKNNYTFSFLKKNIQENNIVNVELINSDCRDVNIEDIADRIYMGYHDVDISHLSKAIEIAKNKSNLHLHPIAKVGFYDEWINMYSTWMEDLGVKIIETRTVKVKDFSPGLHHIEIVITIQK